MARKKPDPKPKPAPKPKVKAKAPKKAPAPPKVPARRAAPAAAPDLRPGPLPVLGNIPWGYGQTRITAIPRDPSCVFAYWEFPDQALEEARRKVDSTDAGIVLRVYDTTYKMFDGTNANGHFDVPVDRSTNRYYLHMNRPATTFTLDVGVKNEWRFATIARSGPAATPRNSPSGDGRADWMTVPPKESFRPYRHRFTPKPGGPPPPPPPPSAPGVPSITPEFVREILGRDGWVEAEWTERAPDGNLVRCIRWTGPVRKEMNLFFPGQSFERIEVEFRSEPWIVKIEKGERRHFGPWNVAVYGWETRTGKQLIQRWTMHSTWVTEERSIRTELPVMVYRLFMGTKTRVLVEGSETRLARESWSSELLLGGASEMRWLAGSELRLAGSSETMFLAASEWMALGASEWMAEVSSFSLGGSERAALGASERWADYPSGSPLFPPGGEKP